jgi:hypothetical protein
VVALQLLKLPSVIFLDEPTSGKKGGRERKRGGWGKGREETREIERGGGREMEKLREREFIFPPSCRS